MLKTLLVLVIFIFSILSYSPETQARRRTKRYKKRARVVKKLTPKITHTPIKKAEFKQPIAIQATLENKNGVEFVILHYALKNSEIWTQKELVQEDELSNLYTSEIPLELALTEGVKYYIEAMNEEGVTLVKSGSEEKPYLIEIFKKEKPKEKPIVIKEDKKPSKTTKSTTKKTEKHKTENHEQLIHDVLNFKNTKVYSVLNKTEEKKLATGITNTINRSFILRSGAKTVLELLNYIPSIDVKMSSSGRYIVSLRGHSQHGKILFMLNGNKINNPYNGEGIYDLPARFIRRIEITKGAASSFLGTDGIIGTIHIITTKYDQSIDASGGLFNSYDISSNYSIQRDGFNINLSGGIFTDEGSDSTLEKDDAHTLDWSLTHGDKTFETDRWKRMGYFLLDIESNKFKLFLYASEHKNGSWIGSDYVATRDSSYTTDMLVYDLSYKFVKTKRIEFKTRVHGSLFLVDNYMVTAPKNYRPASTLSQNFDLGKITKEQYDTLSLNGEISLMWKIIKGLTLNTSLNYQHFRMLDYDLTRNHNILTEEYYGSTFVPDSNAVLGQKDQTRDIITYRLLTNYQYKDFKATAGMNLDYYDSFGITVNPKVGVAYSIVGLVTLKALYGQGFKAPTLQELYDEANLSNSGIKGNEDLKAETMKTMEFAVLFDMWDIHFYSSIFYNINDNIIEPFDPEGGGKFATYENIGNTKDLGVEAEASVAINQYFTAFLNVSWFQRKFSWNKSIWTLELPELDDRKSLLTTVPMRKITMGINANFYNFGFYLGVRHVSRSLNNNRMIIEQEKIANISDYWKFDFNVFYNITPNLLINFAGYNLGTTSYAAPLVITAYGDQGLVQPGYSLRLGLTYKFDFED